MILADAFQIRDRASGRFLQWELVQPHIVNRFVDGRLVHGQPARWGYVWHDDPQLAGAWSEPYVDNFLAAPENRTRDLDGLDLEKVRAPACGCCGKIERDVVGDRWQITTKRERQGGVIYWRCEKHVGRNPCCIEGCGKTFALKPDQDGRGAEDYSWRMMCGRCWRQAPKWMRDRVSKIRRLARRRGWTDKIHRLHGMAWEACHRAIVDGRRLDETEINKLFGWDE